MTAATDNRVVVLDRAPVERVQHPRLYSRSGCLVLSWRERGSGSHDSVEHHPTGRTARFASTYSRYLLCLDAYQVKIAKQVELEYPSSDDVLRCWLWMGMWCLDFTDSRTPLLRMLFRCTLRTLMRCVASLEIVLQPSFGACFCCDVYILQSLKHRGRD